MAARSKERIVRITMPPNVRLRFRSGGGLPRRFYYYYMDLTLLQVMYDHVVARLDKIQNGNRGKRRLPVKNQAGCECKGYTGMQ